MTVLLILAIAGVVSWGLTYVVRLAMARFHGKQWFNPVIRASAIVLGGAIGTLLMPTAVGVGIGLAGGVLNTTVVAIVKSRLKGLKPEDLKE